MQPAIWLQECCPGCSTLPSRGRVPWTPPPSACSTLPSLGQVLWSYGPGDLDAPHHPTLTPEGTILIFDNGRRRGWSRVLEIDPHSGEQTWEYRADGFFSEVRGGAQRLPGGTTLITESERGRVFEVTREGEIVWEWWNPVLEDGARRRVYRATRLPE